ncbi:MAG TPA: ABC transporter ATP-binding protein [Chitinolyticbacter sp.]|nr:ABC transporter ATP-binding protein [Chitinolyticbacter sp.]
MTVLAVDHLALRIPGAQRTVYAVDDVSFAIAPGEVVALVGESGSGKTLTALALAGLNEAAVQRVGGSIRLHGEELTHLSERALRRLRGAALSVVFQDPMATLNPVLTVGTQLTETVLAHRRVGRQEARRRAVLALQAVGLPEPELRLLSYPHQLSGGMRQRVAIAAALINEPALLIADEATTALDVTLQAQILALVRAHGHAHGTAVLWVTHDLALAAGFADRVLVMYGGQLIETGPAERVLRQPAHPYTAALLAAISSRAEPGSVLATLPGQPPDLAPPPAGCRFRARCPIARAECAAAPALHALSEARQVRCFFPLVVS